MTDTKWTIDVPSRDEAKVSIRKKQAALEKCQNYLDDVALNPLYSPVHRRITKLKGSTSYPEGSYRYRKDPLRVVYFPEKSTQTVYTLEAATADSASYKIRSKKK